MAGSYGRTMQDVAGLRWDALGWEMAQDPGESPRSGFWASGAAIRAEAP